MMAFLHISSYSMFIPSEVSLGIYTRTVLLPLSKKEKQVKFIKTPIIIKGLGPSCQKGLKKMVLITKRVNPIGEG